MSQSLTIKAKGIHTNNSYFSASPEGSMEEAVNVVIDRGEIVEPRRGFAVYGSEDFTSTKQILSYKDSIIKHHGTTLSYDSDNLGTFLDFTGDAVTETVSGLRIKSVEMNGNLYITSTSGIKKISATNLSDFPTVSVEAAGALKAIDLNSSTNYSSLGFLEANSKVAYRVVFGKKDINENLLLGTPSARTVVWNISTTNSCVVDLTFTLPSNINTSYFYQIYRTALSTESVLTEEPLDAGEEMYLVIEDNITSTDITNGFITVTDSTPDDFRANGALLYNNPVSGEGIAQSNDSPPFAKDIAAYKNALFYANTKTIQRLNLSFLTVNGIVAGTSDFRISDGVSTETYGFQGTYETETINYNGVVSETNFYNASSGTAKYFTLVSANDARKYCIWFYKTANDIEPVLSGYINIKVTITGSTQDAHMIAAKTALESYTDDFNLTLTDTTTNILTAECSNNGDVSTTLTSTISGMVVSRDNLGTGEDSAALKIFLPRTTGLNAPSVGLALEQIAKSLVKVVNANSNIVNSYYASNFDQIPGQIYFEHQSITGNSFHLLSNIGSIFNPTLPNSGTTVSSSNEVRPNRLYYSKIQQPEAVPIVNYIDIGPKDREIKRILGLRDSLFILKEDGIYRLSGEDSSNYTVVPFDYSAQVLAPDTAVVLNNQIYALSTQGVIVITDTGVSVISRPIENQILKIVKEGFDYKTTSFGVAYESDRSYLLFLPSRPTDTVATQCFRYNTFTNTWTKWDISKRCGLVNFRDDKLYLSAGDINAIEQERKTLTRIDHADREYLVEIQTGGIDVDLKTIQLNTVNNIEVGDVLQQKQYLTMTQFNRLLKKLDADISVLDVSYYSTLELQKGQNPRSSLVNLVNKIDGDFGSGLYLPLIDDYTHSATSISVATQTVLTIGAHNIKPNRYVTISGSNSTPSIDGTHKVLSVTPTTITIDRRVTVVGTSATVQTDVNDPRDIQACFNIVVDTLNADTGVFDSNYLPSTGTLDLEQVVLNIDKITNTITVTYTLDFLSGESKIYKAIKSYIVYNPQTFGDPSVEKQVSQCSLMFEDNNFDKMVLSFKTDKSIFLESITFTSTGNGDFGTFSYGSVNFGGESAPIPLRTLVPLSKQRCRFISIRCEHKIALQNYSLLGASFTFRPYNVRSYT